jgi:integrase
MHSLYFTQEMVPTRTISLFELRALYLEKNGDLDKRDAYNLYRAFEVLLEKFPNIGTDALDGDCLETFQKHLASKGYAWGYCQKLVQFIRAVFYWGARKKLVSAALAYELKLVPPLKHGTTRGSINRQDVPRADVEKALPFFPLVIADMVRLQLLTGMRPSEVCGMTPGEINKTLFADRWLYEPAKHKNAWRGKKRTILLGQAAKDIIERNNGSDVHKPVFANHRQESYKEMRYAHVVRTVLKLNGLPKFTPYQLRHTAFTEVSLEFGCDYADAFVGHSVKGVAGVYDHSQLQKQWYVVQRRQGCFTVKTEFSRPALRIFTGD